MAPRPLYLGVHMETYDRLRIIGGQGGGPQTQIGGGTGLLSYDTNGTATATIPLGQKFGFDAAGFADQVVPHVTYVGDDGSIMTRAALVFGGAWVDTVGGDYRGEYGAIVSPFWDAIYDSNDVFVRQHDANVPLAPGEVHIPAPGYGVAWNDTRGPMCGGRLSGAVPRTHQWLYVWKDGGPPAASQADMDPRTGCYFYGVDPYGTIHWGPPDYDDVGAAEAKEDMDTSWGRIGVELVGTNGAVKWADSRPRYADLATSQDVAAYSGGDKIKFVGRKANGQIGYAEISLGALPTEFNTTRVAHWYMDEASGIRSDVVNGSDFANTGTVNAVAGIVSNAASFTGTGDRLIATPTSRATTTTPWTMVCWIKTTGAGIVLQKEKPNVSTTWQLSVQASGTQIVYIYLDGTLQNFVATTGFTAGQWTMVAFGWNATDGSWLSVNAGTRQTHAQASMAILDPDIYCGAGPVGESPFTGAVDEVELHHANLTDDQLSNLYDQGTNGFRLT